MKKITLNISIVLVVLLIGLITYLVMADKIMIRTPVMVESDPRVTFYIGNVEYKKDAGTETLWQKIEIGTKLAEGYEVRTGKKSYLDISFDKKTAIRITSNSSFKIDYISIRELLLNLKKGSLYGKFEKIHKDYKIKVKTPTAIAAIRGTELGFEIRKVNQKNGKRKLPVLEEKKLLETNIYAVSGITEVHNPEFKKQKVLLSYQTKINLKESSLPGNPEQMEKIELRRIRTYLNAIHIDEVLLISDKILFKTGSARILRRSYPELDRISSKIKEQGVKVRIEGHTDNLSSALYNYNLSVERAREIKKYFIKKGVSKRKLLIKGFGESKPIASNKSAGGRAQNRRVEFIIVD